MTDGVRVEAQLRIEGPDCAAELTGAGSELHVVTDRPVSLLRDARRSLRSVGRGTLARAAERLDQAGLTVDVSGPSGVLVTVGSGRSSIVGRLLTGTGRVRPGQLRVLAAALRAEVWGRRHVTRRWGGQG